MALKLADKEMKVLGELTQSMADMHSDCDRRKTEAILFAKKVEALNAIEEREPSNAELKEVFNMQQDLEVARTRMWQAIHNHFECWGLNVGIRLLEKGGRPFLVEIEREELGMGALLAHLLQHGGNRS